MAASSKKSRLGRGLNDLFRDTTATDNTASPINSEPEDTRKAGDRLEKLPIELLRRGKYQPRTHMDEDALQELADSITAQGVVQPILVRQLAKDAYEIIAGERRWRAAQMAGLHEIPAVVREVADESAMAVALIENIQRENLNPIEEANGIQRLLDEFGLTHQAAADSLGRSRAAVTNLLRLLTLHSRVREQLEQGRLDMGHARALLALPSAEQPKIAQIIVNKGLSVRATESLVKQRQHSKAKLPPKSVLIDPDVRRLQEDLSNRLGATVSIDQSSGGRGKLTISYSSLEELDGIIDRIK